MIYMDTFVMLTPRLFHYINRAAQKKSLLGSAQFLTEGVKSLHN